jgi:uncharacterized hydrophobic protein (TIGR00271 family)
MAPESLSGEMPTSQKMPLFIYEGEREELPEDLRSALKERGVEIVDGHSFFGRKFDEDDRVVLHGSLIFLKRAMHQAEAQGFSLGILPTPAQKRMTRLFRLPTDPIEALDLLLRVDPRGLDLLYAGEEPVFYNALVGEAPPLAYHSSLLNEDLPSNRFKLFWQALGKLRHMHKVAAKLTTAKGTTVSTAITGALVFNRESNALIANLLQENSYNDGQLRALLISPLSVVSYVHHLLVSLFSRFRQAGLPGSVGLIKSQSLLLECDPPLMVAVDGVDIAPTPVEFAVHPKALKFCAPEAFWERNAPTQSDKETLKVDHLPQGDEAVAYARKRLPFFTHATEQEYRDLFAGLREEAKLSSTFVILMILSTLLATVGLFLNSASVVIGAMLLAPLMQPIISFAMGLLRWDGSLASRALRTVLTGTALVLLSAMTLAWLLPFREVTSEMAGRLHPTLLDLLVAVVSGLAAAYAKNNPKISGSLVGVAIAVALVPPLSTAGIGLGWGEFSIFTHAFLLFLTNFAGIVLAAAFVFMLMGFSPLHRAKKGLIFSAIVVLIVAMPLTISFRQMAQDARLLHLLENRDLRIHGKMVHIDRVRIRHAGQDRLLCDLVVSSPLKNEELTEFKKRIDAMTGEPWTVEIEQRIRL